MPYRSKPALRTALVGLLAVCALTGGLLLGESRSTADPASRQGPDLSPQQAQSRRLREAPSFDENRQAPTYQSVEGLSEAGARLGHDIPLPPGSSFAVVDWKAAAAQGGDSETGIQSVLEFQAACQWYRYASTAKATDALSVIADVPQWPTFRASPTNKGALASRVAEAFSRDDIQVVADFLSVNCR